LKTKTDIFRIHETEIDIPERIESENRLQTSISISANEKTAYSWNPVEIHPKTSF